MYLPAFLLLYYLLRCNAVPNNLNFSLPIFFQKLTTHSTFRPNVVVLVVFYPKNYIPSEQKAFEEASSWFYPVRQPFVKRQQREDTKYTSATQKNISYLSTYLSQMLGSLSYLQCQRYTGYFFLQFLQWSDFDCYIWRMQRGPCVLDESIN